MTKILLAIFLMLLLSACHNVKREYIEVPIDRPVYCAELPEIDEYAVGKLARDASFYDKVEALLIEREERIATEAELRAIIKGCSKE